MYNKNGLPIQKKCVVSFIDILGISQKIEKQSEWALDWIWLYYTAITNELKNYKHIKFKIFSDNILLCAELNDNPQQAVLEMLSIVRQIEMSMLKMGAMFLRGAIVIDDLHFSENFVYGKALLKAYQLESSSAVYPRIIIDESIFSIVNNRTPYIALDKDNQYFYDFLQARIDKGGERLSQELSNFRGNILVNLSSYIDNVSTVNKMEWAVNYFNDTCQKNGLKHSITLEELNKLNISTSNIHLCPKIKKS